MELSGNNFLAYLSGRPPRCSMSEETRNWIQEYICNPLLSFAEHRLLSFVCVLLVPEYILAWVIGQYLKARKIVSVHKGELCTLNKTLNILNTQLHQGCSKTLVFFTIMGGFHLFQRASKGITTLNTSLISRKTMFRFIHSPFTTPIITQPATLTSPYLRHRPRRKSTGSLPRSTPNALVHNAVRSNQSPSSHPSRNCDACVCGHEFHIHLLVEQTSQRQSTYSSVPKI